MHDRKRRPHIPLLLFGALMAVGACDDGASPGLPTTSDEAATYLDSALDLMEAHSVNRYEVDWTDLRQWAEIHADGARTPAETYPGIRAALQALGDGHSYLVEPGESGGTVEFPEPMATLLTADGPVAEVAPGEPRLGYLMVPWFSGGIDSANALAERYHALIEGIDTMDVCGWVVDLRSNPGGNMWPMLAGVGPILGQGVAGYFVDPDSVMVPWSYQDGGAYMGDQVMSRVDAPYDRGSPPPVALLMSGNTTSSGEAMAVSFARRPDTRSFGIHTRGLTTAIQGFGLRDGAVLGLAVSRMADRTGHVWTRGVTPDVLQILGFPYLDMENDLMLRNGIDWLLARPECGG